MVEPTTNSFQKSFALTVEKDGTVFQVKHIYAGNTSLNDLFFEFLSRKIDDSGNDVTH